MPMPVVLRQLPFFERPTAARIFGQHITIKADQIIVWGSVAPRRQTALPANAARFPAILDTGLSHNFAIREEQLAQWAGVPLPILPVLGHARAGGVGTNVLDADVWLHRNRPGQRDELIDRSPFRLQLRRGILVYPRGTPNAPRLPLLGLRSLRRAGLQLTIDCRACRVSLRTPRWWWLRG
jgi:hypothetical protein